MERGCLQSQNICYKESSESGGYLVGGGVHGRQPHQPLAQHPQHRAVRLLGAHLQARLRVRQGCVSVMGVCLSSGVHCVTHHALRVLKCNPQARPHVKRIWCPWQP